MMPLRYRVRVVGIAAYQRALAAEIARGRQLGRENRDKMADPNVRSTKGVWHDHADAENPYEVSKSETRVPFFLARPLMSTASSLVSEQTGNRTSCKI